MADGTDIEWTRHPVTKKGATWNIVTGCQIVSPGCTNCYAMRLAGTRLRNHPSRAGLTQPSKAGPVWNGKIRFNEEWLDMPLRWKTPRAIFVCAHGDLFADGVTDDMLDRIFAVMALCPQHIFQVLTKRPRRMWQYLDVEDRDARIAETAGMMCPGDLPPNRFEIFGDPEEPLIINAEWPLPNVWLGVSVEDQQRANRRIPDLLNAPAAVRFISAEPLLGPVDLTAIEYSAFFINALIANDSDEPLVPSWPKLDWVIAGGESGPNARPMHPDWIRQIRDDCERHDVPLFFKQWGAYAPRAVVERTKGTTETATLVYGHWRFDQADLAWEDDDFIAPPDLFRVGKKAAGRMLDGKTHEQFPEIGVPAP